MKRFYACRSYLLLLVLLTTCIAAKGGDAYSQGHYDSAKRLVCSTIDSLSAVYCANFKSESTRAYNFDKGGEWKIYYESSISALKPTSASEAYVLPSSHLHDNGNFQLLPVDTLYAGTTYILYGCSEGEIEYISPEQELPREVDSPLAYADKDIEYSPSSLYQCSVYRPDTKTFEPIKEAGVIKQGEAYLCQYDEEAPDRYTFTGVIEPRLEFVISSYRLTDLLTNTEKTVTEPQCLSLTYTKNIEDFLDITDCYICDNFFGYNGIWAQTLDYSTDDISLQPDFFSFLLSLEEDEETGIVKETIFFKNREWIENTFYVNEDPVKITYDAFTDTYQLTPFYVYTVTGKDGDDDEESQFDITGMYYFDEIILSDHDSGVNSPIIKPLDIKVVDGTIYLDATERIGIYNMQGINVYNGKTNKIEGLSKGFYIITVNGTSIKIKI